MCGFYRLAAAVPELKVAAFGHNLEKILESYFAACDAGAAATVFPELSLTGYSCGDLFFQRRLLERAESAALEAVNATAGRNSILIFGIPLQVEDAIYNVAVVAQNGMARGIVP